MCSALKQLRRIQYFPCVKPSFEAAARQEILEAFPRVGERRPAPQLFRSGVAHPGASSVTTACRLHFLLRRRRKGLAVPNVQAGRRLRLPNGTVRCFPTNQRQQHLSAGPRGSFKRRIGRQGGDAVLRLPPNPRHNYPAGFSRDNTTCCARP